MPSSWLKRLARGLAHLLVLCGASSVAVTPASSQELDSEFDPKAFVQEHCIRCHGAEKQKADRRFDTIQGNFSGEHTLNQWQEILDAVNRGEMPPEDEPRPTAAQTKRFVTTLTLQLETAYATHTAQDRARFRRMNRYEYRYTIRDLCGVNIQSFDPTTHFPADEKVDGFENIGEELVISDYLLQRYLEAASQSIAKASQTTSEIEPIHKVFSPNDLEDRRFHFRPQISFQVNVDGSHVDVGHGDRFSDRVQARRFEGVPADGYYTIRIKAEAINREHPYDPELLGIDRDEPIKMEVLVADPDVGSRLSGNATDRSVAVVPLKDHQAEVYEYRTWMDKGFVPILRYINGPQPIKSVLFRIAPKYHPDVLPSNWRSGTDRAPAERKEQYMSDVYQGPRMRIHRMEIEGPERAPIEETSLAALYGEQASKPDSVDCDVAIKRFLLRAFRRPPLDSEVNRYRDFMKARVNLGESEENALLTTFRSVLCSPNFLYVEVPPDETKPDHRQFRLASRLSYFLWSSMPDDELFEIAAKGQLDDAKILRAQIARMLKDPRAKAFTEHFTDSWLRLNELGSMPPDTVKFPIYYKRQLEPLMKRETHNFFHYVLANNLSIKHFIDADFTFLNRYLADHYDVPGVAGDEFERVSLPKRSLRGGLLGHASVLTTTSNGVETSPVTRGIWVLENILGTPPSPPPPDVEPLEPDIRGATTIREQLVKHREVETCAECHRKIDPIGFALESFDPIGGFRTSYVDEDGKPTHKVDTSGRLATGEPFVDLAQLKRLLLDRHDQFAKCLSEKMLTYAIGRELTVHDRSEVAAITERLASRGHGLRDLVELIVLSNVFRE